MFVVVEFFRELIKTLLIIKVKNEYLNLIKIYSFDMDLLRTMNINLNFISFNN